MADSLRHHICCIVSAHAALNMVDPEVSSALRQHQEEKSLTKEQSRRTRRKRTTEFKKRVEQMLDPKTGMSGGHKWTRGFNRAPSTP